MKAIIDTCVIVDVLQARQPFYEVAQNIFLSAAEDQFSGYITANSVSDIYYITHKLTHDNNKTKTILSKLFTLFQIIDTAATDCYNALLSPISDYEDAMMVEATIRINADCIVTRNIKDYKYSKVDIYTPEEFISHIKAENE